MRKITIFAALMLTTMPMTAYAADVDVDDGVSIELQEQQDQQVSADKFQHDGVIESGDKIYTWYSENVLPGEGLTALNENGRTVDENGYVVDGDGYIAVASPWGVDDIGTVIETPFGLAKVYDVCEGDSYDVYTSW